MSAEPRRTGELALPRRIGQYEAFLQIGAGGMARVYLAVHHGKAAQPQLVVVKILRPEAVEDEHVLALFMDEARIAVRLQHPNVIRTREVIAEPPDYVLAMDFQNGQSLLHVLRRLGRQAVPLDEHIYIISKVLAGLSYAHELKDENGQPIGIVHRDVSPANVLVSYTGEVKLLDFGIAKATGALAQTQDGVVKGKLGYAAPEQCLGKAADPRSDVYAVGVMLWEAIAGRRRASGETWHSVLQARLEDAEPQLEEVCPDAPDALKAIARRALAHDPDQRYATAREFQSDLEKYLTKVTPRVGAVRVAAMMKPHFDQDRADQHRAVEGFLKTLRSTSGSGARPGLALPKRPAAAPSPPSSAAASPVSAPRFVEEEQTSRIPVDAALLIMTRKENAAGGKQSTPPARAAVPTSAPPAPSISVAPASRDSASPTAPPPPNSGIPTAPPPPDKASVSPKRSTAPTPSFPTPLPGTDPYGVVRVSRPVAAAPALVSVADARPPRKKSRLWPVTLVAVGAVGIAAFGVLPLRHHAPLPSTVAAQRPAATAVVVPVAPPPVVPATKAPKVDMVKVRISVDPPDAVVKLDGHLLPRNPFVADLVKDTELHELTAYAEGCRDARQVVHLNQDVDLLLALKRLKGFVRSTAPRSAAAAPAAAQAPAPAAPGAQPAAQPAALPAVEPGMDLQGIPSDTPRRRTADENNPYEQ